MSAIVDVRAKLAAVIAPVSDDDPDVQAVPVDAVTPPMLVVTWRAPMLDGWAACNAFANLAVWVIGERVDLEPGYETIETQYQRIVGLLRAAGFAVTGDSGTGPVEIAKTLYLGCRVDVRVPVTL